MLDTGRNRARLLVGLTALPFVLPFVWLILALTTNPSSVIAQIPFWSTLLISVGMTVYWARHVLGSPLAGQDRTMWLLLVISAGALAQLVYAWRFVLSGEFEPKLGPLPPSPANEEDSWDSF